MLLKRRDGELEALRSEVDALKTQLVSMAPATEQLKQSLRQELAQTSGSAKEREENLRRVQGLEGLLREKEDLLTTRDGKIERLESELKEKRKELARLEIEVWQSIERRNSWKRKLAKFGIPLKD
jgi:chromosome segregation ATPase